MNSDLMKLRGYITEWRWGVRAGPNVRHERGSSQRERGYEKNSPGLKDNHTRNQKKIQRASLINQVWPKYERVAPNLTSKPHMALNQSSHRVPGHMTRAKGAVPGVLAHSYSMTAAQNDIFHPLSLILSCSLQKWDKSVCCPGFSLLRGPNKM